MNKLIETHEIPFTQYLRPDGRKQYGSLPMPDGQSCMVQEILDAGWDFECEVLTTNEVSLTVSNGLEDVAIEICANGPPVADALRRLVVKTYDRLNSGDFSHGMPR